MSSIRQRLSIGSAAFYTASAVEAFPFSLAAMLTRSKPTYPFLFPTGTRARELFTFRIPKTNFGPILTIRQSDFKNRKVS